MAKVFVFADEVELDRRLEWMSGLVAKVDSTGVNVLSNRWGSVGNQSWDKILEDVKWSEGHNASDNRVRESELK